MESMISRRSTKKRRNGQHCSFSPYCRPESQEHMHTFLSSESKCFSLSGIFVVGLSGSAQGTTTSIHTTHMHIFFRYQRVVKSNHRRGWNTRRNLKNFFFEDEFKTLPPRNVLFNAYTSKRNTDRNTHQNVLCVYQTTTKQNKKTKKLKSRETRREKEEREE